MHIYSDSQNLVSDFGFKNNMKVTLKNTLTGLAKRQDLVRDNPVLPGGVWSRSKQSHDGLDNSQSHDSTAKVRV